MDDEYIKMSDEELIGITVHPLNHQTHKKAKAELHRRQKQQEAKNILLQKRILKATICAVIIAAITLVFVVISFFISPNKITSEGEKAPADFGVRQGR